MVVGHPVPSRWGLCAILLLLPSAALAQLPPAGSELQISTTAVESQHFPAVAGTDGGFVVTWSNGTPTAPSRDGGAAGVLAQRLSTSGAPLGSELVVNTYTTGQQRFPAIAGADGGQFLIVWEGPGAGGTGIFGQRFDAAGAPDGGELPLFVGPAFAPAIASDAAADLFVVTWWGGDDGGAPGGIFAQRYDGDGAPVGSAFLVNSYTTGWQRNPAVAATDAGDFVVVWQSLYQDGDGDGVFGRRHDAGGMPLGTEFRVNEYTTNDQRNAAVARALDGGFVVVWQSRDQDGSSYGVFGKRYDDGGMAVGNEFRVNSYTSFDQLAPRIARDTMGRFLVVWNSLNQDGDLRGIFAQQLDATAMPVGTEFQVNTSTTGSQEAPAVSGAGDAFLVVWDSGGEGVRGQRYADPTATPTTTVTPTATPVGGCPGDCDGGGAVSVDELVRGVNIALGSQEVSVCPAFDTDGSNDVTVDELIRAVNAALNGCP